ncbi:MAG TPA: hypothetical protein VIJ62_01965 [Rhizomicrobium sp.]
MHVSAKELVCLAVLVLPAFSPAEAALIISSAPTANVTCAKAVCTATASNAVLNANHLQSLLAKENVKVATDHNASDIRISTALNWVSAKTLTLDARRSIIVNKPVSVSGAGGLALITNDGSTGGELSFGAKGNVTFWSLSDSLTINGASYTLVNSLATLASNVIANPRGNYALATDYNAGVDGTYGSSPIPISIAFQGVLDGLGNAISNFSMYVTAKKQAVGLFGELTGTVENLRLINVNISAGPDSSAGAFVAINYGTISGVYVSGIIEAHGGGPHGLGGVVSQTEGTVANSYSAATVKGCCQIGGLAYQNDGTISNSYATGAISGHGMAGGLVAVNGGTIESSYAGGTVNGATVGGLVAMNGGTISNSYASGSVSLDNRAELSPYLGGLVGTTVGHSSIVDSYSKGAVIGGAGSIVGGLIGEDDSTSGNFSDSYWDTTTSGITNSRQGAGNIANDPGITGLTTVQLQSGLPAGFDPSIWDENPSINGGLPYLRGNPPT